MFHAQPGNIEVSVKESNIYTQYCIHKIIICPKAIELYFILNI